MIRFVLFLQELWTNSLKAVSNAFFTCILWLVFHRNYWWVRSGLPCPFSLLCAIFLHKSLRHSLKTLCKCLFPSENSIVSERKSVFQTFFLWNLFWWKFAPGNPSLIIGRAGVISSTFHKEFGNYLWNLSWAQLFLWKSTKPSPETRGLSSFWTSFERKMVYGKLPLTTHRPADNHVIFRKNSEKSSETSFGRRLFLWQSTEI